MAQLPVPQTEALQHSQRLVEMIAEEIKAHGPITFKRYMELALYAPGLGYYSAGAQKFGADGDFVTAPEISPLFSQCLAGYCSQVISQIGGGDILEFGAGSGVMAADILLELDRLDCLPERYYILEVSAELKQRQQQLIKQKIPSFFAKVVWLDALPEKSFNGVVLANEVLDAMPVHRFKKTPDGIKEWYVNFKNQKFTWHLGSPSTEKINKALNDMRVKLEDGYESEICLAVMPWIKSLASIINQGEIIVIDYGFPGAEYYHPQRSEGTLMCHYRHHAHSDPFYYPGLQDITAHVDFDLVVSAAQDAGLKVVGYKNQASFLLQNGLATKVDMQRLDLEQQMALAKQIKLLTLPTEMGELFKVLILSNG